MKLIPGEKNVSGVTSLVVHVIPGARQDSISRDGDGLLRIKVRTPPVDGRANDAVCALLAKAFVLRPRQVSVMSGHTSRTKRLAIEGVSAEDLIDLISRLPAT